MNKLFTMAAVALLAVGCHAQVPPTPPVVMCPAIGVYMPLNAAPNNTTAASITGTTYADVPGAGSWCYIVQSWAIVSPATVYQVSSPSNVAGPVVITAALPVAALSWTGVSGYTYIVSRAPATTAMIPVAPVLPSNAATALIDKPSTINLKVMAKR